MRSDDLRDPRGDFTVEIKARCPELDAARRVALEIGAMFDGKGRHKDTYFDAPRGYFKLRESDADLDRLVYYDRERKRQPKLSHWYTVALDDPKDSLALFTAALSVRGVVEVSRETFVRQNVRIQFDRVRPNVPFLVLRYDLGPGETPEEAERELLAFAEPFPITSEDWIAESYCEIAARKPS